MKNLINKIFVTIISIIISLLIVPKKLLSIKYLLTLLIKIGVVSFNSKKIYPIVSKLLDNFNICSPKVIGFISGIITGISASQSIESTIVFIEHIGANVFYNNGWISNNQYTNGQRSTEEIVYEKKSVLADVIAEGLIGTINI
jgi:hypothetical protein